MFMGKPHPCLPSKQHLFAELWLPVFRRQKSIKLAAARTVSGSHFVSLGIVNLIYTFKNWPALAKCWTCLTSGKKESKKAT
jgi:hypothetical protein